MEREEKTMWRYVRRYVPFGLAAVLLIVMLAGAASAVLLVGGGKRYVEPIYNRQE